MNIEKNLTPFIGISLIILAMLRAFGFLEIKDEYIFSFSIAAMLFSVADFINFSSEITEKNNKKNSAIKRLDYYMSVTLADTFKFYLHLFAVLCIVTFPVILQELPVNSEKITDFATLFSLGILISLIGVRHNYQIINYVKENNKAKNELREIQHELLIAKRVQNLYEQKEKESQNSDS